MQPTLPNGDAMPVTLLSTYPNPTGITLYEGSNYAGAYHDLDVGRYASLADSDGPLSAFNNTVSSLHVAPGYQAILYTEANFQGERIVLQSDSPALAPLFENQISSLEIRHDPDAVIGYSSRKTTLNELVQDQRSQLQSRLQAATTSQEAKAIEAEIAFLNIQLANNPNKTIYQIEVEDTHLDLGQILVTGNYLTGGGTLDAAANSHITIDNSTNAALLVNTIDIASTGGGLFFNYAPIQTSDEHPTLNAAINVAMANTAADQPTANFSDVRTLASQGRPEVVIQNTNGRRSVIQLQGDINNALGIIRTQNEAGDTLVNGNLRAQTVDVTTGENLIQSYIRDHRHIGGVPESQWWRTAEASARNRRFTDQGADFGHSAIVADNVFIAGRHLNINGTIQAGRPNHSVVITNNTQFQQAINYFNTRYANNNSQYLFDFNVAGQGITTVANGDKPVRVQWNARDQRIETHNIDVAGGYLELHGHIYSTGNGQLKVLDGHAKIDIQNNTDYDLQITSLTNTEVEGRIKITDTNRSGNGSGGFHVTEIERLGDTIRQHTNGVLQTSTGREITYRPKSHQAYHFSTYQDLLQSQPKERIWKGTCYGCKGLFGESYAVHHGTDYNNRGTATLTPRSEVILTPGSGMLLDNYSLFQNYSYVNSDKEEQYRWQTEERFQGHYAAKTRARWHYEDVQTYRQHHDHYIDADRPIAIEFIGNEQGLVNVRSNNSNVILDGPLSNLEGRTTIHAQTISAITDASSIQSDYVHLTAKQGIHNIGIAATSAGGDILATTTQGDLDLAYTGGALNTPHLVALNGEITFTAHAAIQNGHFTGDSVTLTSTLGGIHGTIDTGNTVNSVLTATARQDIDLQETQGDLRVNRVESEQGNVTLRVDDGNLIDAQASQAVAPSPLDQLATFASEAAIATHIEAIELAKQAEFDQYWRMRHQAGAAFDPDTYVFAYTAAEQAMMQAQGMTAADMAIAEQQQTQWLQDRHAEFGPITTDEASFVYQLAQTEETQLKKTLAATLQTRQDQIDLFGDVETVEYFLALIHESAGLAAEQANVMGHHVTLITPNGEVGQVIADTITVDRTQLLAALTPEQQTALSLAEANGLLQSQDETVTIAPIEDFDIQAKGIVLSQQLQQSIKPHFLI